MKSMKGHDPVVVPFSVVCGKDRDSMFVQKGTKARPYALGKGLCPHGPKGFGCVGMRHPWRHFLFGRTCR